MNTIYRYICYHPKYGYLRFGSYSQATVSSEPDPRGMYSKKKDAERRKRKRFWINRNEIPGSEIEIKKLKLSWEVI